MADTLVATYLASASPTAGSVAEGAASREDNKYSAIVQSHVFLPLAIEIIGPINFKGLKFLSEFRDRLTAATDDPREAAFLFQRISILIQRFNAVCFQLTFTQPEEDEFYPLHKCFLTYVFIPWDPYYRGY